MLTLSRGVEHSNWPLFCSDFPRPHLIGLVPSLFLVCLELQSNARFTLTVAPSPSFFTFIGARSSVVTRLSVVAWSSVDTWSPGAQSSEFVPRMSRDGRTRTQNKNKIFILSAFEFHLLSNSNSCHWNTTKFLTSYPKFISSLFNWRLETRETIIKEIICLTPACPLRTVLKMSWVYFYWYHSQCLNWRGGVGGVLPPKRQFGPPPNCRQILNPGGVGKPPPPNSK